MTDFFEILRTMTQIAIYAVAIKSISGLHWPWEKCPCCGKKYSEHKREDDDV